MSDEFEGIVILGAPRSGTTLLRRLLNTHSAIACPGETHLLSACARFLQTDRGGEGLPIGVLSGLAFAGFDEAEVLGRLRELAFGFQRDHARKAGKRRWAEKTAFDAFHLAAIERLCGQDARFICLVRHGLDVACSLSELCEKIGGYPRELHEYIKLHPRPLEAFAHAWVDLTSAILTFAQRHRENSLTLRYEDLVADPEKQLRRVLAFLGEAWEPALLETATMQRDDIGIGDWKTYARSSIDNDSVGRFTKLPRRQIEELAEITNPTLAQCGYETIEVREKTSEEEARRRYRLGLLVGSIRKKTPV